MGTNVATLGIDVEFEDIDRATDALDDLEGQSKKTERETGKLTETSKKVSAGMKAAAVAATAAAIAFGAIVLRSIAAVNELGNLSARLGLAVQDLQTLNFAFEQTGVSTNTAALAFQRLQRRVAEAAQGTGEAVTALQELGLEAEDLTKLTIDEQFRRVAEAFDGVTGAGNRTRLAFKLFDSEGVSLLQTMSLGSDALFEMEQRARDLGLTMDEETVAVFQAAEREMKLFSSVLTAASAVISKNFLVALSAFALSLEGNVIKRVDDLSNRLFNFATEIATVVITAFNNLRIAGLAWFEVLKLIASVPTLTAQSILTLSIEPFKKALTETKQRIDGLVLGIKGIGQALDESLENRAKAEEANRLLVEQQIIQNRENKRSQDNAVARVKITEEETKALDDLRKTLIETEQAELDLAVRRGEFVGPLGQQLADVRALNTALDKGLEAYELQILANRALNLVLQANVDLEGELLNFVVTGIVGLLEEEKILARRVVALQEATAAAKTFNEEFMEGLQPFVDTFQSVGEALGEALSGAFNRASDALTNFLVTGEFDFRQFANAIISDLIRIAVQQAIVRIGASIFGFREGAVFEGGSPVAFADGGVIRSASRFTLPGGGQGVAGENGAEAILPLTRTPGGQLGVRTDGAAGGNTIINVTVENPQNAADAEQNGELMGQAIVRVIRQQTITEIKRQQKPGNILNRQNVI